MNQHVTGPKRQTFRSVKKEDNILTPASAETRAIEAFMGPDGRIYLPEGTVLAEDEELFLDSVHGESKPILIQV